MAGFVVGVTGGIGSGKSAVCKEFERHGIEVVDAVLASAFKERDISEISSTRLRCWPGICISCK